MHPIEQRILQLFAKSPLRDLSTSELVMEIFSNEHDEIQRYIYNETNDSELHKLGKRKKARLHRKLLYHLNKLTEEDVLKIARTEGKGEKYFCLNSEKQVNGKRDKAIKNVIESVSNRENDHQLLSGIEDYENQKIIKKFDEKNWVNKTNAILLESEHQENVKNLYNIITEIYPSFNDVLALNGFEYLIDKENLQELTSFVKKANLDTKDYDKYLNILIDLSKAKDSVKLTDFITAFSDINPQKIFLTIQLTEKSISNHTRFLRQLVKKFDEHKIKINFQNLNVQRSPMIIGRAGTYSLSEQEYSDYLKFIKGKTIGLCISETSVCVDIHRFKELGKSVTEFRDFLLKAAKALLLATTAQRRKSDLLFKTINDMNKSHQSKFFAYSLNYIRLWNYDVMTQNKDFSFEDLLSLLKTSNESISEFCKSEETIFKSCGIPIRFKVVLSSALDDFDKDFLSIRNYKKVTINSFNELSSDKNKESINRREKLLQVFNGDRVRINRASNFVPDDIIVEFNYLMTTFNIPLFSYDFEARGGEMTLDAFM